jgi:tetratricopeptide (TPR) repeat protein
MSKLDYRMIEEYQKLLEKDPRSKAFAALAESYRDAGMLEQAENLLKKGVSYHPKYAPGYVVLGRVYIQKKSYDTAVKMLAQAIELSPDNLLAHQLLGEVLLLQKKPREALKAHKMAMFLNPENTRSRQVVKTLEALEAEEYEADLFEMKPLAKTIAPLIKNQDTPKPAPENDYSLDRGLSFVDALILRHNLPLAKQRLIELNNKFPTNPQIEARFKIFSDEIAESATAIKPLASREKQILDKKIHKLRNILASLQANG